MRIVYVSGHVECKTAERGGATWQNAVDTAAAFLSTGRR